MIFALTIKATNVGVDPEQDGGLALAELIKQVGERVADGRRYADVRDANGNLVGAWTITGD